MREVRTFLERFANMTLDTTILMIFDAILSFVIGLRALSVDTYIRKVCIFVGCLLVVNSSSLKLQILLGPDYVLETTCNNQGRELRESGRRFYNDKFKATSTICSITLAAGLALWARIPYVFLRFNRGITLHTMQMNKQFGEDWARLTKDLLSDSEGSLKFKPEL
jgi:hypothetical protein